MHHICMEILLIIVGIGFLIFGYSWLQDRREEAMARRLEGLRKDPTAAAGLIDAAISRSKVEADTLGKIRDHRF